MNPQHDDPTFQEADAQAVIAAVLAGTPLSPDIVARVRRRSERKTEEVRRRLGTVQVAVDLVREGRDEP